MRACGSPYEFNIIIYDYIIERDLSEPCSTVLNAAGLNFENVVDVTVMLQDIKDWPRCNEIYKQFFSAPYPARTAFQAAALPLGAKIEINARAVKN